MKSFKDKHLKNTMIDKQAKNFNLTGHELWQLKNSMRTMFGKINKKKSGQARIDVTTRQTWLVTNFGFLTEYLLPKTKTKQLGQVRYSYFFGSDY